MGKKEFGNLPNIKSTTTTTTTSSTSSQTQNDDHKDNNNTYNNNFNTSSLLNLHSDDIILPSYDSISSIRSALARYEAWQYNNNQRHNHNQNNMNDDFMNMMPINNIPTIIPSLTRRAQQRIDNNGHNNYQYNVPFY